MVEFFSEIRKGEETKPMFLFKGQGEGKARKNNYIYLLFIAAITYVTSNLSDLKQHTFIISACGPGICFNVSHKAGAQHHPEPRSYLEAAGEGSISKFTWLLAAFRFLKGCYTVGPSS